MNDIIYTSVVSEFGFYDFFHEDVRIERPDGMFKTIKRDYDLVVFNPKKVIFFARVNGSDPEQSVAISLRAALNSIVTKLSLSLNDFVVCGADDKNYYYLNKHNDRLYSFEKDSDDAFKIIEFINNELLYGGDIFDHASAKSLSDSLTFSSFTKESSGGKARVKTSSDGTVFVYKHGNWYEASDLNTETIFSLAALGGTLGLHLFYQKKRIKGILYLLTLGLCGVGWFFDSLEILFGIYKDADGKYLVSLENKLSGFIVLLVGAAVSALIAFAYIFLFKFAFNILPDLVSSFI